MIYRKKKNEKCAISTLISNKWLQIYTPYNYVRYVWRGFWGLSYRLALGYSFNN